MRKLVSIIILFILTNNLFSQTNHGFANQSGSFSNKYIKGTIDVNDLEKGEKLEVMTGS